MTSAFDAAMYERIRAGCKESAKIVAPRLDELFSPSVVFDVGGGEGWWAAEFPTKARIVIDRERPAILAPGVEHVGGVDFADWTETYDQADLVICLEVAEHLPAAAAAGFVAKLVEMGNVVAFSAAIPGQGGHGHLNEQWPSYWDDLFLSHGYACSEDLRWEFWNDARVEPWYRQNLLVFAPDRVLYPLVASRPLPVVHPEIYGWRLGELAELRGR